MCVCVCVCVLYVLSQVVVMVVHAFSPSILESKADGYLSSVVSLVYGEHSRTSGSSRREASFLHH